MDHKISKPSVEVRVVNSFCYTERLILDPMKNTADPDPEDCDSRSRGCDPGSHLFFRPLIPDPIYFVTTLTFKLGG